MPLIEGQSLSQKLTDGPLRPSEAAMLVARVAEAMHHAHEKGLIHLCLPPSNILLDDDGQPHIVDFGLARRVPGDATLEGQIVGIPSYMSPEQAQGRSELDHTADVYSLGAVLYELLTGRPPFRAATLMETLRHVVESDPVSIRALSRSVPRDLETICMKCLVKAPRARYQSAAELADDLRRFLEDRPVRARKTSALFRLSMWCRRHRMAATLSLLLLLLITVLAVAVPLYSRIQLDRLASTNTDFEQGLRVNKWTQSHIAQMDRLLGDMKRIAPSEVPIARSQLNTALASHIQALIDQPELTSDLIAEITELINELSARDEQLALDLRNELDDRIRDDKEMSVRIPLSNYLRLSLAALRVADKDFASVSSKFAQELQEILDQNENERNGKVFEEKLAEALRKAIDEFVQPELREHWQRLYKDVNAKLKQSKHFEPTIAHHWRKAYQELATILEANLDDSGND